ncbi:hypothetical protein J6590_104635 [Homalodisca vitripennis]|nr:hypothetical protein J6590_104635 [Homalodisca vitripennis]
MLGARLGCAYMETPVLQLEQRFHMQSLLFLFKLINGLVDCPALKEMVDLSVPRGTRSRTVFCRKFLPTNYACNSGAARILRHEEATNAPVSLISNIVEGTNPSL